MENQQTELESRSSDFDRSCAWHTNSICAVAADKPCPDDCTLRTVPFTRDGIIKQMRFEESECQCLKREGMFKNRLVIKDKIGGLAAMQKALIRCFKDVPVESHVVDKDIERTVVPPKSVIVPSRSWRRGLF